MSVARVSSLVAALCAVLWFASSASAATVTYTATGGEQTFAVPAGVTQLHVVAVGASGAAGGSGLPGGKGALVTADLPVSPGSTLYVEVGGNGSGTGPATSTFNGGAPGGDGCCPGPSSGGAGGGATDLRTIARAGTGTLGSRLLVA